MTHELATAQHSQGGAHQQVQGCPAVPVSVLGVDVISAQQVTQIEGVVLQHFSCHWPAAIVCVRLGIHSAKRALPLEEMGKAKNGGEQPSCGRKPFGCNNIVQVAFLPPVHRPCFLQALACAAN